jgi:hypothetical protein
VLEVYKVSIKKESVDLEKNSIGLFCWNVNKLVGQQNEGCSEKTGN